MYCDLKVNIFMSLKFSLHESLSYNSLLQLEDPFNMWRVTPKHQSICHDRMEIWMIDVFNVFTLIQLNSIYFVPEIHVSRYKPPDIEQVYN
jgi:hypothetical protein